MVRFVRQKKEFICSKCGKKTLKFSGYCPACNAAGTMQEHILIPIKVKARATTRQKSLITRAKNSERSIARSMLEADGPDPAFRNVTSSTGRVGHITGMQIDAISRTYVIENKNRALPVWIIKAWIQILQRADDFGKYALLHIEPPNLPKEYTLNGVKKKTGTMALITQTRHEQLIAAEKRLSQIYETIDSDSALSNVQKVKKVRDILGLNG